MRALVRRTYGSPDDVLEIADVGIPTPAPDQVLVRVVAASVNPLDHYFCKGTPHIMRLQTGLTKPKQIVLGADIAGVVEEVGSDVTELVVGDEVFGEISGSFAEFAAGRTRNLARKPDGVLFEQAAAIPVAGLTALQALRDNASVSDGDRVLVIGASGGVGTYAVQIAKRFGAEVTAVCSTRNVEMVASLGADRVVDYKKESVAELDQRFDTVIDNVGGLKGADASRLLAPDGTFVLVGAKPKGGPLGPIVHMVKLLAAGKLRRKRIVSILAEARTADLEILGAMLADGSVRSVIDREFTLETADQAIHHQAAGHARGKSTLCM